MRKNLPFVSVALALLCAPLAHAGDATECVRDGSIWTSSAKTNPAFQGVRFARVDESTIRIPGDRGLKIGNLDFGEIVLVFAENDVPATMTIMMYNKGDDGALEKSEYDAIVKKATEALDELTGVKGKIRKVSKKEAGLKLNAMQWEWEDGAARLESSASGKGNDFQAEFVRLKLAADAEGLERGSAADVTARSQLKGNVKREGKACWVDGVPMVDQGQKGYCVPATLSRLFAYYGMDGVDQHTLAALCGSSGDRGTSHSGMEAALKKISTAFHVRLSKVEGNGIYDVQAKNYTKVAKRMNGGDSASLGRFDPKVLKEVLAGKPAQVKKWLSPVVKSIDAGVPVVWSVVLGIFPEPGLPQTMGGHMRLITGYDLESNEIIYSDSWGNGHEMKRMPADNACAMTAARYILRPTR